jgi:outer membrane usher protein
VARIFEKRDRAAHTFPQRDWARRWGLSIVIIVATIAGRPIAVQATEMSSLTASFQRLNTSGHSISLSVPLMEGASSLGDIVIIIRADDSVFIPKTELIELLKRSLDDAYLKRIDDLSGDKGRVTSADLKTAGVEIQFDRSRLTLDLKASDYEKKAADAPQRQIIVKAPPEKPASVSGFINAFAGLDYYWGDEPRPGLGGHLDLESALRVWDVVLETDASIDGNAAQNLCPLGAACAYQDRQGLKRTRSRLVYDLPEDNIRIEGGDAEVFGLSWQRTPDIGGVTIEKSPTTFQNGDAYRSASQSTFQIDRPSDVEVFVNGAPVRSLHLSPGAYDLSDVPLPSGASRVELRITDNTGRQRTMTFTTYSGTNLLAAGKSEWSASAGVPSYLLDGDRIYEPESFFATGFFRYGLTNAITGETNLQADPNIVMGGMGAAFATPIGLVSADGAMSESDSGLGFAAQVGYELSNFRGPLSGRPESMRMEAEYRSTWFRVPGEFIVDSGNVLYPQFPYWLRLATYYTFPVGAETTATFGARYQFSTTLAPELSPLTFDGNRYGVDLTLARPMTQWSSGALTLGYSNESYAFADTHGADDPEVRVMVRLSVIPAEDTRIETSYDTLNGAGYVSGYKNVGQGAGSWQTSVIAQQDNSSRTSALDASATYSGNRADVRVSQISGFHGTAFDYFRGSPTGNVTSLEVGAALAYADGTFAIGRPVRGNSFAILTPYDSLAGKKIVVGSDDDVRAQSDWLGPAVVPDIPAYSRTTVAYDVPDLPVGYSLGSSSFDAVAPYKAGYKYQVGSAYSVSVFGTLLDSHGGPVSLLTGIARLQSDPQKQVEIFTNAKGRFAADGLAAGHWDIEMATDDQATHYVIDVPPGTIGLFKAGEIRPAGAV